MDKEVISRIDRTLLKAELTPDKLLRKTNKANNEIYIFTAHNAPNAMLEVGRLRELAFRNGGGGTGKDVDTDEFDYMEKPYTQLVVWDPEAEEILGGYRFIHGSDVEFYENGQPKLITADMYHFSEKFIKEYLPCTIELGRSFVQPDYQSSKMGSKSLFALDNLWDGLGALIVLIPDSKYFFGKFTMYQTFDKECRNMILYYIYKYFPDPDKLVYPIEPMELGMDEQKMQELFDKGEMQQDYRVLNKAVRARGCNIPPLVNAYISLSPTMKNFGTAVYHDLSNAEETCIMITIDDIFEDKKKRHIESYLHSVTKNVIRVFRNMWKKRRELRKEKK
jgi:hypothetical protein